MKLPRQTPAPLPRRRVQIFYVFLILAAVSIVGACLIVSLLSLPMDFTTPFDRPSGTLLIAGILFLPQAVLLSGAPGLPRLRLQRRRSMIVSMIGGSLLVGAITVGLIGSICSIIGNDEWLERALAPLGNYGWTVMLVPWAIWFVIFAFIWSAQWITLFRRIYKILIAGTILELIVTIPIDVKIRKQTQCYCGEGTFWGMGFGLAVAFCTFGPAMALLYLARYTQRMKLPPICQNCGYDIRGLPEPRCPECGTPFDPGRFDPELTKSL
jgi:hypothetical protein